MRDLAEIKAVLGRPAYEDEQILLYQGDALQLMDKLSDSIFDQVVTSPPYNIGKSYEQRLHINDYLEWMAKWIEKVYRLTKPNGSFWLNVGYTQFEGRAKAIPIPYLIWERVPFYLIQEIVWNYGAGVAARKSFSPRNEKILWYVKNKHSYTFNLDDVRDPDVKYPNQKKNGKLRCNTIGKNPSDVWQIAKVTSGTNRASAERTAHPAQFPLDLVTRIIKAGSNPGELLLEPFAGSGSLLEAAAMTGRRAVGFEIRPDYVEIAVGRLRNFRLAQKRAARQPELFPVAALRPPAEQRQELGMNEDGDITVPPKRSFTVNAKVKIMGRGELLTGEGESRRGDHSATMHCVICGSDDAPHEGVDGPLCSNCLVALGGS